MARLRAMKMLCVTLLVCTGAMCLSFGFLGPGLLIGFVLLAVGIPVLVRQWTDRGVLAHLADAWRWVWDRVPRADDRPPTEPTTEAAHRG